jgi:hypothetical protein
MCHQEREVRKRMIRAERAVEEKKRQKKVGFDRYRLAAQIITDPIETE